MEEPGDYLKREREVREITLENISRETKVSVKALKALEANDFDALPPYPFVKGFIRSYSKCIGIDGDDAVLRYDAYLREKEADTGKGKKKKRGDQEEKSLAEASGRLTFFLDEEKKGGVSGRGGIYKYCQVKVILPIAIVILIVVIALFLLYPRSQPPTLRGVDTQSVSPAADVSSEKGVKALSPPQAPPQDSMSRPSTTSQELTLQMTAKEPTWMSVEIDDEPPLEVSLGEGETVSWKAKRGFSLLIGNAGGVEGVLNGKPLASFGEEGKVVRINLVPPVDGEGGQ
jgi:cytoskeleton protein RodZ